MESLDLLERKNVPYLLSGQFEFQSLLNDNSAVQEAGQPV